MPTGVCLWIIFTLKLTETYSWVYRRFLVADGNFKADHVRQKPTEEVWLSEGGSMFPRRAEYRDFLAHAVEMQTVSDCLSRPGTDARYRPSASELMT